MGKTRNNPLDNHFAVFLVFMFKHNFALNNLFLSLQGSKKDEKR